MFKFLSIILLLLLIFKSECSSSMIDFTIIYSEDIFSYDFNNISFIKQNEGIAYISESQIKDSLICYIIINDYNKTIIELNNYTNIFQLEYNGLIHESFQLYSIKLIQQLDYEQTEKYELYLISSNNNNNNNIIYKLIIKVNDTNDNWPIFEQNIYYFNITENNEAHTCFGTIKANDLDSIAANNGVVRYKLLHNTLIGYKNTMPWNETIIQEEEDDDNDNNNNNTTIFYLNNDHLCTQFELDREQYYKYTIEAIAFDLGEPISNQTKVLIHINVLDLNDNEPIFYHKLTKNEFYLRENSPQNTFIAWFKAYDLDDIGKNSEIEYKIMNNNSNEIFNIDSKGVLTTNTNLTSNTSLYSLDIRAKDKGEPISLETKINITIKLITEEQYKKQLRIDVYPNRSLFYIRTDLLNVNNNSRNNRSILKLNAYTNDSNSKFIYQLIPLIANNCSHDDVLKLFNLTKNGELFLSNKSKLKNQICLVKIKVTDLSHPIQMSNQIEFTFIFTDLHSLLAINGTRNKLDSINNNNNNNYLIIIYFVLLLFLIVLILLSAIIYNYYDNNNNNNKNKSENNRIVKINMKKLFKWFDTTNCNNSNNTNSINQEINSNDEDDDDEFNLNNNDTNLPKICNITNNISSFSSIASKNSSKKSIVEEQLEKFEKIYYDNKKYLDSNLSNLLFNNNNNNNNNQNKKELII
jgi:hypothetical protein